MKNEYASATEVGKIFQDSIRMAFQEITYDPESNVMSIDIGSPHEIDLRKIQDERDLLSIVCELASKRWMKNRHIKYFIEEVCKIKGWEIVEKKKRS